MPTVYLRRIVRRDYVCPRCHRQTPHVVLPTANVCLACGDAE